MIEVKATQNNSFTEQEPIYASHSIAPFKGTSSIDETVIFKSNVDSQWRPYTSPTSPNSEAEKYTFAKITSVEFKHTHTPASLADQSLNAWRKKMVADLDGFASNQNESLANSIELTHAYLKALRSNVFQRKLLTGYLLALKVNYTVLEPSKALRLSELLKNYKFDQNNSTNLDVFFKKVQNIGLSLI